MPKIATQIRLDENLHEQVKTIAEKELRSLNAQMEYFIKIGVQAYNQGVPNAHLEAQDK
jgi:hypothetical protein